MFVLVEFKHSDFFYFLQGLFATHQTLSSQCWIFSSWSRSKKIRRLLISKFFFYCFHSNIGFTKNYIFPNFNPYPITNLLCRLGKAKRPYSRNISFFPDKVVLGRKSVFIWQLASILSYLVRLALTEGLNGVVAFTVIA